MLSATDGSLVVVLKESNGAFREVEIRAQDEGAARVAERLPELRVATVLEHMDAGRSVRVLRPGRSSEVDLQMRLVSDETKSHRYRH